MNRKKLPLKGILAFVMLAFVLVQAFANSQSPKVKSIGVKVQNGGVSLDIQADKPVQFRAIRVNDPAKALVFEVFPAVLWGKKETRPVNQAGIRSIRIAQYTSDPDVMRVVLDLDRSVKFVATPSEDRHRLLVSLMEDAKGEITPTAPAVKSNSPTSNTSTPVSEGVAKALPTNNSANAVGKNQEVGGWKNVKIQTITLGKASSQSFPSLVPSHHTKPLMSDKSLQARLDQIFIAKAMKKKKAVKSHAAPLESVTYSWKNADLMDVIRSLADRMHLNVIIDTAVKGTVTLDLKNVPAGQALGMILAINGYASRQVGNILVVAAPDKLDKIPSTPISIGQEAIQVIPLESAKASELQGTITQEYPNVKIHVDTRTNSLLVRGSIGEIRQVKGLVADLDKPVVLAPAVPPQKEVIALNYTTVKVLLAQIKPLLPSDAILIADERLNTLIVIGSQYVIDNVKSFVAAVDVPSPQVMLEMRVVSIEITDMKQLGIDYGNSMVTNFAETAGVNTTSSASSSSTTTSTTTTAATGTPTPVVPGSSPLKPNSILTDNLGIHSFVRDNLGFTATLHYLISNQKAKVLASPRIATINNKEATIQLGQRLPIPYFDPRAGLYQVQYIDVGVILKVTPLISSDGSITVHVAPQSTDVTGFTNTTPQYPQLYTRQADTNLRVKNGETIVLGGLLGDNDNDTITKIPLLGDIPIIGEFFRNRSRTRIKDELVISITPTLIANK